MFFFVLNGEFVDMEAPDPRLMLSSYLHQVGLTGTKVACGQGGCGARVCRGERGGDPGPSLPAQAGRSQAA